MFGPNRTLCKKLYKLCIEIMFKSKISELGKMVYWYCCNCCVAPLTFLKMNISTKEKFATVLII